MRVPVVVTLPRVMRPVAALALCLALATPAVAVATPAVAVAAPVAGPATVALGVDESVPARTKILGASDEWVVYGLAPDFAATSLRDGHTVALGGHGDVPHLAGSMVVFAHVDVLEWTDLETGESGTAPYAAGTFAEATPTGWLLGTGASHAEFLNARTGAETPIAVPAQWVLNVARVGPSGMLLQGSGGGANAAQYVQYANPQTVTPLAESPYCLTLTAVDVACSMGTSVSVVPLDGSPAITWDVTQAASVNETTTRIGWTDFDGLFRTADKQGNNRLVSLFPMDVQWSTTKEFLYVGGDNAANAGIYRVADIGATPTLVVPLGAGVLRAKAIAVGPGRVAWVDSASSTNAVWTRDFRSSGGSLSLAGGTAVVAHASAWMDVNAYLATSGRRTVYGSLRDLQLFANGTTTPLVHTSSQNWINSIQLSGSRLLFVRYLTTTVIDVRTRATIFTGRGLQSPQLFGNYLAYALTDGSVWRKDLVTGRLLQLQGRVPGQRLSSMSVAQHGDFVAWQGRGGVAYRNARTLTAAVRLPAMEYLVGLTGAGVLTGGDTNGAYVLRLRAFNSRAATTVFTHARGYLEVAVGGGVLGWLDDSANNQPRLTAFPAGRDRAQLLGNARVPLSTTKAHTWSAEWDTSAPLTSCSVQLLSGHTLVRTLACDSPGMAVGVATAKWDGKSRTGVLTTGHLTWRLVAANRSGSLLAADASAHSLTGRLASR